MVDVAGERMGDLVVFLEEGTAAAGVDATPGATVDARATVEAGITGAAGDTGSPTHRRRAVPLAEAQINVADLALTRGDGIFESIGVIDGRFIELDRHLARLEHSAALLDLPRPDAAAFAAAARRGVEAHTREPELLVKLFYSRGIEGADTPSGWIEVLTGDDHRAARSTGIRVVTLDRGYRHDIAQTAPWLLQGAKTLSYALNKAALREAARRGADDVIFVSTDDVVLEGPTSNVLLRHGDLFRTPRTDLGILAGTTQAAVFETLAARGFETLEAALSVADLVSADAVWLLSSGRLVAPVRELDGQSIPVDRELTGSLLAETFGVPPVPLP
ncbi:aminodeoxychorismate lyase [Herbiconiux ginsengi]|uniref:4-amino-4-deoxychorismate lyase n=1 Tax=Herbiconiux ginsengi TaxID=381665 RepID=A0A1H3L275_9MICO|nr:aminodeoxychorismate lyase [Herbiconiux ginsengi]SDY58014.1 4-amino-4-deoxychorismate lyase [Herbiconiux ginsengi]